MIEPLEDFSAFTAFCRSRLEAGRAVYGTRSFAKNPAALLTDVHEELADAVNYLFILRCRLRALESALARLETTPPHAEPPPAGRPDFDGAARAGLQIDPATFAALVAIAERMGLSPALTLRLALRALEVEMDETQRGGPGRLVGKERGLLEGKP